MQNPKTNTRISKLTMTINYYTILNLINAKSTWFNKRIPLGGYIPIAPAKEHLSISLKEFINRYDRLYIHKRSSVIERGKGLAEVLYLVNDRIKTANFTDLLVRGYRHDFRIIIYLILCFGFTLWFNTNPLKIPQIEVTHSVISSPYIYDIGKYLLNFNQCRVMESTSCLISKIEPHLLPIWPFDFDSSTIKDVKYVKEDYNQGLTEVLRITPFKLSKIMCMIHLAEVRRELRRRIELSRIR